MNPSPNKAPWLPSPGPVAAVLIPTLVALALRLVYLFTFQDSPAFALPIMDEAIHDGWARGSMGFMYEGVPYFRAPLYMWFLQACYAVNDGYFFVRLVQMLLSALTVAFVADLGRRISGPVAGLVSGLLLAFCWPVIYFAGELVIVTLFSTLIVAGLWSLCLAAERGRLREALVGAALLGIASAARPTVLVFLPGMVWLVLRSWRTWLPDPRGRALALFALLALMLLPGIGLTVRNQVVGGDAVFIASQGGLNFFIGNNAQSDGRTAVVPGTSATWAGGYQEAIALAEEAEGRQLAPSEVSRHYYRRGLEFLVTEPASAAALYGRKLRLLVGAAEQSNNKNPHFWRAQNPLLRIPVFSSWAIIFAMGLVGLVLARRRPATTPLALFLGLYAVGLLLFFINERFRTPETIVLACFAGTPVVALYEAWSRQRRRALGVGMAVLVLISLSSLDRIGFHGDRVEADAFSQYTLGNLYLRSGDPGQAARSYQESLETARRFRLAHFSEVERMARDSLILALLRTRNAEAARQQVDHFASAWPDDWRTPLLEGRMLAYQWRFAASRQAYEIALERNPAAIEAVIGIGRAQIEQNVFDQARQTLRQAAAMAGPRADIYGALALLEISSGGTSGRCWRYIEDAFALDEGEHNAHHVAGELYRYQNQVGAALYHFRQALLRDPNNVPIHRYLVRSKSSPEALLASEDLPAPPPRRMP